MIIIFPVLATFLISTSYILNIANPFKSKEYCMPYIDVVITRFFSNTCSIISSYNIVTDLNKTLRTLLLLPVLYSNKLANICGKFLCYCSI